MQLFERYAQKLNIWNDLRGSQSYMNIEGMPIFERYAWNVCNSVC